MIQSSRLRSLLFLLVLAGLALAGGLVHKGRVFLVDANFTQGFEEDGWQVGWTMVDGEGSGSSWSRLSASEYYSPFAGNWSLGCRYNADGSANDDWLITPPLRADSARTTFTLHYRSQDVNHQEHIQILSLETDQVQDLGSLGSSELESLFQVELENARVPSSWQTWTMEVPADTTRLWYVAVRCLSADRFVLLVDGYTGLNTVATGNYFVESRFRPHTLGAIPVDTFQLAPLRIWNLASTESLWVVPGFHDSPWGAHIDAPFYIDNLVRDTLLILPEASLDLQTGIQGTWEVDDGGQISTLRFSGSRADTLLISWTTSEAGPWTQDTIAMACTIWDPDSLELYAWSETFSTSTLDSLPGWGGNQPTQSPGWQIGEFVSSLNFTVPWRESTGSFVYINSDAQGLWRSDGTTPAIQNDTLWTPWIQLPAAPQALTLSFELYYDDRAGSSLQLLGRDSAAGWQLLDEPEASGTIWSLNALGLNAWLESDSLQLAFVYQGSWSYGVALDNLALQAGDEGLPVSPPPAPRPPAESASVQVSPNPFNPITRMHYQAPEAGVLHWQVYNLRGQRVFDSGPQRVWRGENLFTIDLGPAAAGIYLLRIEGSGPGGAWPGLTRKITLLK